MNKVIDSSFFSFFPEATRYLLTSKHAGVEGSFQMNLKKKFGR